MHYFLKFIDSPTFFPNFTCANQKQTKEQGNRLYFCILNTTYLLENLRMNKQELKHLLKSVELTFGRGESCVWKNRDFQDLSFLVHQKTKVLISPATLKRIFGKVKTDDSYTPQETTLKALCVYADFENKREPIPHPKPKKFWIAISAGIILIFSIIIYRILTDNPPSHNNQLCEANITLNRTEGICPLSAYFSIDIPESEDSVFIDFGDRTDPVFVKKSENLSHFYAFPGQFRARLITNNQQIAASEPVLVQTDGWQSFACYFAPEKRLRYYPIPLEKVIEKGTFSVSPQAIAEAGMDTTEVVVVQFDHFKQSELNGDNFKYDAIVRNSKFWPAIRCYSIIVKVEGSDGKIEFKLVGEGCSAYASCRLNEVGISANTADLKALVYEREDWLKVKILNENKRVSLFLNERKAFDGSYSDALGTLIGTSLEFHGGGAVKEVILSSDSTIFAQTSF